MTDFGQVPTAAICRFGELTKSEIIVLCYLYASRNRKTGQCNPRQKQIVECTKIGKSHVSEAVAGLEIKGWIVAAKTGEFYLSDGVEKFPKQELASSEIGNSSSEFGNSSSEIGNLLIKDLMNIERTEKEHRYVKPDQISDEDDHAVKSWLEAFPDVLMTPYQAGCLVATVTTSAEDREAWSQTVETYKLNFNPMRKEYLPHKISNVLSVFRSARDRIKKGVKQNGGNAQSNHKRNSNSNTADVLKSLGLST